MRALIAALVLLTACSSPTASGQADCEARGGVYHPEREECFGAEETSDASADNTPSEPTAEPTTPPTPRPTRRPTPRPTPTAVAREELLLVEQGFTLGSSGGGTNWAQVGLVFENPNSATHVARSVTVQLTFYDANNALAGSSEEFLGPILPGQKGALGRPVFDVVNAAEMEVEFRVDWESVNFDVGAFTFEEVSTTPAQFGGFETRGFVVSSFEDEQENVQVVAIYKDAEGNVLGGESTYVDFVPAGERSPFEISTFSQFTVPVSTTDMYAFVGF